MAYDVIVIGAGLAGLSAGFELSWRGKKVLLLESEPIVGGRTSSWDDDGMKVESSLHRFKGYYTALPDLLFRAGIDVDRILKWEEQVAVKVGLDKVLFGLSPFHGPIKALRGFLGNNKFISVKEKLALARFFAAGFREYVAHPDQLDAISVLDYAKKHGLNQDAVEKILIPLSSGFFFLPPQRYSTYAYFGMFFPGLKKFYKLRQGTFNGGMTEVMADPLAKAITRLGGTVKTYAKVEKLLVRNGRVGGVLTSEETFEAPYTIIATTLAESQRLVKPHVTEGSWFDDLMKLESMSSVSIQLELDKPSMAQDMTTFAPYTCLGTFSEQSRTTFPNSKGRLSIILTPPERFLEMEEEDILEIVLQDAMKIGLNLETHILDYRVVRYANASYSLDTGNNHLRPSQKTPVEGLVLAGDYTQQPYFATMEGAVVSGRLAAQAIL
ncbi:FAD-dependent oxidoreductase [Pullulanibacillus sp. KACC 23026]|uniref:hydroxysqualene dehydroxylase n=1 Tax=Pullulanibacillus sp. KACC 23026 TaxID=3028315 RepID=UPI0023B13AB2|nr:FAD-dependent oxidoreductase [Pullulanibacillus sp. KACC 23026]WEG11432.1 FAD-dependent oxidoreductase [Pullulanibacillus sp. KACC 23026]